MRPEARNSGHEGGVNILAIKIVQSLKIESILTTGTETNKSIIVGMGYRKNTTADMIE